MEGIAAHEQDVVPVRHPGARPQVHQVGDDVGRIGQEQQPRHEQGQRQQEIPAVLVQDHRQCREGHRHPSQEEVPDQVGEGGMPCPEEPRRHQSPAVGREQGHQGESPDVSGRKGEGNLSRVGVGHIQSVFGGSGEEVQRSSDPAF